MHSSIADVIDVSEHDFPTQTPRNPWTKVLRQEAPDSAAGEVENAYPSLTNESRRSLGMVQMEPGSSGISFQLRFSSTSEGSRKPKLKGSSVMPLRVWRSRRVTRRCGCHTHQPASQRQQAKQHAIGNIHE